MNDKKVIVFLLFVSLSIALVSYFTKSFWNDEIWSIYTSKFALGQLAAGLTEDYHPPLYFILLKAWAGVFSFSELSMRLFQGMQTFIFLLGAYLTGRKIVYLKTGMLPFLLVCFSAELWLFAPMLRYYIFAAALALFSTYFFLVWVEKPINRHLWLPGILYVLLLYTDYPTSAIIALHFAYLLLRHRPLIVPYLKAPLLAGLFFLPWAVVVAVQISKVMQAPYTADINTSPLAIPVKLAYSFYAFLVNETVYPFELTAVIALLVFAISLTGIRFSAFRQYNDSLVLLIVLAAGGLLFTALLTTYVSVHTSFIYTPSRTLYVLPFFLFILAIVYQAIRHKALRALFLVSLLTLQVYGIVNIARNRHYLMPAYASPWKQIVEQVRGRGGYIAVDELMVYEHYTLGREKEYPKAINQNSRIDTIPLAAKSANVFIVVAGRESTPSQLDSAGMAFIGREYRIAKKTEFLTLDEDYRAWKKKLTKRDEYTAKFTLYEYHPALVSE